MSQMKTNLKPKMKSSSVGSKGRKGPIKEYSRGVRLSSRAYDMDA